MKYIQALMLPIFSDMPLQIQMQTICFKIWPLNYPKKLFLGSLMNSLVCHMNWSNNCGLFTGITLGSACWLHGYLEMNNNKVKFPNSSWVLKFLVWVKSSKITKNEWTHLVSWLHMKKNWAVNNFTFYALSKI